MRRGIADLNIHLATRLALALLLCGTAARLSATDELLAWDDFESYAAGTITPTSGSAYAGGDGWATSGAVGWAVDPSPATSAAVLATPGLVGSGICLNTAGVTTVRRALRTMTPATAQPIWISFVMKATAVAYAGTLEATPANSINFDYAGSTAFSINTLGNRLDGTTGNLSSPICWRLSLNVETPPPTSLEVDDNPHLVVLELTTAQLSLWIFPTATPSASTLSTTPAMDTQAMPGAVPFNSISFQADPQPPTINSYIAVDDIRIGTTELAVTASGMPHVTGLAPSTGVVTGGDPIGITGTGFDGASQVSFGGNPATAVASSSGSALTCLSPASTSGLSTVDVVVSNSVGSALHAQCFTYQSPSASDPSNTAPPSIDDSAGTGPGSTWVGSNGTWSPSPSGYSYAWQSSIDGSPIDAVPIGGATSSTYTVAPGDLGHWLRLVVTPLGTSHAAYSAYVQVVVPKGSASAGGSASASGTASSGTGASYAGAVTGGTAGSNCGLGAGAGLLAPALLAMALRRLVIRPRRVADGSSG